MATLEMALAMVSIYDGIRRCFLGKGASSTSPINPRKPSKMCRPRRRRKQQSEVLNRSLRLCGGADWGIAQRVFRGYKTESNSRASCSAPSLSVFEASTDYFLKQHPCGSLYEGSLEAAASRHETHGLPATVDHAQHESKRLRLQRRSLIENALEVIGMQCSSWWSRYSPALRLLSIESSLAVLSRQLSSQDTLENEPKPENMGYMRNFVSFCREVYKAADTVICDSSSGVSPAMDLLDVDELIPALNSALIDYLLRLEELSESHSF